MTSATPLARRADLGRPGAPAVEPDPPRSGIYEGRVTHSRFGDVRHGFHQDGAWLLFDLAELEDLDRRLHLLSVDRANLVSLRSADHFDGAADPRGLAEKVRSCCASQGVELPACGRILGLTQPRVAGYVFNPVSFWWCLDAAGRVVAVVAEINNTFGQRLATVLPGPGPTYEHVKALHVSPFLDMDLTYRSTLPVPTAHLALRMDVLDPDGCTRLTARLTGGHRPLTDRALARFLVRHPLMPLQVTAGIHLQALRLWRKGAPFRHKPPFTPGVGSARPTSPRDPSEEET